MVGDSAICSPKSQYPSVDGSELNGPELEIDTLANWQPVKLPAQLNGTRMKWHLNNYISERVLDTLETVEVALR